MKQFPSCLLLVLSLLLSTTASTFADRQAIPLDTDWLFVKKDADIADPSDGWEKVTLPHTWNAGDAQAGPASVSDKLESAAAAGAATDARKAGKTASNDPHLINRYYRGACWYEHTLDIPAEWKDTKRVFVRVGAASTVARTYLNKNLLGEHRGGFTAFCYELTDQLHYGSKNELRVQVDNSHREDLAPLAGDFNLDGGIYRQVELIVTDKICISPLDYASPGIYLTTQSLDRTKATVEVKTIVSNGNKVDKDHAKSDMTPGIAVDPNPTNSVKGGTKTSITVQTKIKDSTGQTVASGSSLQSLPLDQTQPVLQTLAVPAPHLWKGRQDPYLYTTTVNLLVDGKIVDHVTQPLGLRTVAISREKGFLLNGEPYPVYGVNRHQDVRNKGWAISPQDEENDAAIMKEMGVTAVRDAHYPQSENWHLINDREGVLVWDEVSLVNETRSSRAFWENSEESMREMVLQKDANLLKNPSFEQKDDKGLPIVWKAYASPADQISKIQWYGTDGKEGDTAHTGTAALEFVTSQGADISQISWVAVPNSSCGFIAAPGDYTASFWVKADNLQPGNHLFMLVNSFGTNNAVLKVIGRSDPLNEDKLPSGAWSQFSFPFRISNEDNVHRIAPLFGFKTKPDGSVNNVPTGTRVFIDDVQIMKK